MTESNKIIIPMSPKYVVDYNRVGPFEFSWAGLNLEIDQTKIVTVGAAAVAAVANIPMGVPSWIPAGLCGLAGFGVYALYANSHEKLIYNKLKLQHKVREIKGLNYYSSISSSPKRIKELYPYDIKQVLNKGIIDFGSNKYGILLKCNTKFLDDDDLKVNIMKISALLNSLPPKTLVKIRAKSQIPYQNHVEKMAMKQLNEQRSQNERALLYSMYNMSSNAPKPVDWSLEIGIFFNSKPKEVDHYISTILPGIQDRLKAAHTLAVAIVQEDQIYNTYVNDISRQHVNNNKMPALFGEKAIWNDILRQLMQGSIKINKDHIVVNGSQYITCIMAGVPVGGVSGFPPSLSPEILRQLYRTSVSNEHLIEIHQHLYPVPSNVALTKLKRAIKKLQGNEKALESDKVAVFDLGLDLDDLHKLYEQIKDGRERMFDINYIIIISSLSYEYLLAGIGKVQAILGANSIQCKVPENEIMKIIKSTQFLPYYDDAVSVWLPTSGLARITPIISGSSNPTSEQGMLFGTEVDTNQEVIIDLKKIPAPHTLMIGPTRSGKTSAMLMTETRTILAGDDVIYITNKRDKGTDYLAPANYFKDISQIINLGRQPDGTVEYNINPLEIIYNDRIRFDPVTKFYEHVDFAKMFINLITGGDRSDGQMSYIGELLLELYFKHGIDPKDVKTWKPEKQPTLIEFHDLVERDRKNIEQDESNYKYATINAIYIRTQKFKNTLSWLSNDTNVSLTKQLTVFDLSDVPEESKAAMDSLLIAVLKLRFDVNAVKGTTILIDEAGVLLENKDLQREFSHYLKQAGSFGIRVVLGSQQLADLAAIGPELQANISISEVYGLNINKSIDSVVDFFKFSESTKQFLLSCSKPGMCAVSVGHPYATTYHLQRIPSELEAKIIFGKTDASPVSPVFSFVKPELEQLAREEKIILSDWIVGDTTELRKNYVVDWRQKTVGQGNVMCYIDPSIIDKDKPDRLHINGSDETREHAIGVLHLAGCLIDKGRPTKVYHVADEPDVVAQLDDGFSAFEYQTSVVGGNDPKRLMRKRENGENKYGRLFFIGNTQSAKEVAKAIGTDKIVFSRGKYVEKLINELLGEADEKTKQNEANSAVSDPFQAEQSTEDAPIV